MNTIRQLSEADFDDLIPVLANAYPAFIQLVSEQDRIKFKERLKAQDADPIVDFYGLYRKRKLLGTMRFFDFTMQLLSTKARVAGLGGVAVDLAHKKEKVARDMVAYFLRHHREKGICLAALYPFRPDFYKKMGFGYGAKMNRYQVKPASLPKNGRKERARFLRPDDKAALLACYNRCLAKTHGLIEKSAYDAQRIFEDAENRLIGYVEGEQLSGYLILAFQHVRDNPDRNDILVKELVYENQAAVLGLLTFLHTQADQFEHVIFELQDDNFHYLLNDPRNDSGNRIAHLSQECNTQGLGIMYRLIDTAGAFKLLAAHNFGGQSCRLKLTVRDDFLPENEGSTLVHFENGLPCLAAGEHADNDADNHEVEICLDIADFSSLLMGAVDFKSLCRYGLASISNASYTDTVNRIFLTEQKPVCMTLF
ncbi:MAG: GNAT family N-acetyltransferase [Thermoflexales bacterium]|nr:GNAT family N-acetyltransferase [Thermoflexales bacterium]